MVSSTQARILELLKRFNDGKIVCIDSLLNEHLWYGKSEKTIRRDLDVIKKYFPNSFELIKGDKGCYKAITKNIFENFLDQKALTLMIHTFNMAQQNNLLKSLKINEKDKKIIQDKIDQMNKCYLFTTKPFEAKIENETLLSNLEKAINLRRYITVKHREKDELISYRLKPYKIVFINENFYLASENTLHEKQDISKFSFFRINNINSVQIEQMQFHQNLDIQEFIANIQTPFLKYQYPFRNHLVEIKLLVSKDKAKYFEMKNFFSSQKETKQNDGCLIVTYHVTQELEIENFVKSWIPYVKVITPLSLKEKIENELKTYLS